MGESEPSIAPSTPSPGLDPPTIASIKLKDRRERNRPQTKIICRRLPPTMTEEAFLEQVSPIPDHDYFYFSKPDTSLAPNLFCRAYINFLNEDDIYIFRDKFDDYIFLDEKGNEFPAIVEYAPFQRMPKKRRKKDPKCGTIDTDPMYLEFLESLKETDSDSREPKMEYSYQPTEEKKETTTPLLEYLAARKRDERRRREERQRRRPRNRNAKDDDIFDDDVKKIKPRENEDDKTNDKDDEAFAGDNNDEVKDTQYPNKSRSKSYKEQRRQAEEQRKKADYTKKDKNPGKDDADFVEDEKSVRKDKRDRLKENYKDKSKDKDRFFDKKDRGKFNDKKYSREDYNHESGYGKHSDSKNTEKSGHFTSSSTVKTDKPIHSSKNNLMSNKIKPFTQLPQLNMADISKVIDEMDTSNRLKSDLGKEIDKKDIEIVKSPVISKDESSVKSSSEEKTIVNKDSPIKQRRSSLESKDQQKSTDESVLKRHKSLDEKSQSNSGNNERLSDKCKESDPRTERRIRNKDRPSLAIYQPGMGKFSKQRLEREKDGKPHDSSIKNSSNNSSSNSVNSQE